MRSEFKKTQFIRFLVYYLCELSENLNTNTRFELKLLYTVESVGGAV